MPRALGSYEELLADPDVDAVYISLPNALHVEWSVRALEAGKHVLCEKPLSRHPEEVERAFDAAERNERVLAEAFMWRHHPQALRLRELAGELGELRLVRGAFSFPLGGRGERALGSRPRRRGADGRGLLLRLGRAAAARRARARSRRTASATGWTRASWPRCASRAGRWPTSTAASTCRPATSSRWSGAEGSLFLDDPWHSREPVIERRAADGERGEWRSRRADPYGCELEDFARACAGETEHPFGRDDAVGQARTIAALYEAADSGRAVSL